MDNRHLYQPDWNKVLSVLNGEQTEATVLTSDELSLLNDLKVIKASSQMYSEVEFDAELKIIGIKQRLNFQQEVQVKTKKIWPKVLIAAAIATMIATAGILFFNSGRPNLSGDLSLNDITPGKQGATLTLANGRKISLSEVANGELAREAGVVITKSPNGELVYEVKHTDKDIHNLNILSTAKGQTYSVRLPDGSLVWLNAASSLTYPPKLMQHGKRKVILQGEGYFEIAKDKAHPFIVTTDKQEVEVLGTHFNISSYPDEKSVKTTLLQGSLKVNNAILKPNQQAILSHNIIKIVDVDVGEAVAWKDGVFRFSNDENITSIMRKLARWYNIDVEYKGNMADINFTGTVARFKNISSVLVKMEQTGMVSFKIEGKQVTVQSNQ